MKAITLRAVRGTAEVMADMEGRGLLRRLVPSVAAVAVRAGEQVVERVELAQERSGAWQMLVVACNRHRLTYLASHSDIESWLFFADPACKPLLYVVAACGAGEFARKTEAGSLSAEDFIALELSPNDPQTSYFTVPAGVLHDELTYQEPGRAPVFFVPEPSRMEHARVELSGYEIRVTRA